LVLLVSYPVMLINYERVTTTARAPADQQRDADCSKDDRECRIRILI